MILELTRVLWKISMTKFLLITYCLLFRPRSVLKNNFSETQLIAYIYLMMPKPDILILFPVHPSCSFMTDKSVQFSVDDII